MPNPTRDPPLSWQGLTDLRASLVSQGRFMEAFRFSTAERSAGTAMDDYQTTCLLLQLATDRRAQVANTKDEIPWRIAVLGFKLDLGKLFASLGAKAQAEIWLANLEKDLEECISLANGSAGTLRASDSLDMLTIEFYRLKIAEKEDSTQSRLQQLLILGQKMHAISHIETERTYYLAIEWAQKLYPPKEFDALRTDIQLRTQKLFETQGRVPAEATYLVDLMITKSTSFSEIARRIELIRDFDRRHPHITLPTVKQMSSSLKFRLQVQAGQREYHEMVVFLLASTSDAKFRTRNQMNTHWRSKIFLKGRKWKIVNSIWTILSCHKRRKSQSRGCSKSSFPRRQFLEGWENKHCFNFLVLGKRIQFSKERVFWSWRGRNCSRISSALSSFLSMLQNGPKGDQL
jgi:hypothetical protein